MSERQLNHFYRKSLEIKQIQKVINTILANACYSDKEMSKQIERAETIGNLDDDELLLINQAWDYRKKLARELLTDLNKFLGDKKRNEKT